MTCAGCRRPGEPLCPECEGALMNSNTWQEGPLTFTVPGNPVALKRHRTFRRGTFTGQYDPSKGDKADFITIAMQSRPERPLDEPLEVNFVFCFQRPKSHYGSGKNSDKLKPTAPAYHTGKPDADNLVKFVCDSLNGLFWRDDSIICRATAIKMYGEQPRTEITIKGVRQ